MPRTERISAPAACVVVPVFNRAGLLRECLDSLAAQTYPDWECIIVDDGSSDGSLAVAAEYATRDPRFQALARPPSAKGAAACRNIGIAACTAPFVMFLDSDDLLHPQCLERRIAFVREEGMAADLAVFPTLTFRERPGDRDILWNIDKPTPDLLRFLRLDSAWSTTGSFWNLKSIKRIGGFDESLPGWQDWQVHVVALLEGLRCVRAGGLPDSYWREHSGDQISDNAGKPSHVVPKTTYLIRLLETYREIITADLTLRDAAAALAWHQLVLLERTGARSRSLGLWKRVWRLGYVDTRTWMDGVAALALHGKLGGGLAWSRVAKWRPSISRSIDRSTCHTISLAETYRDQVEAFRYS